MTRSTKVYFPTNIIPEGIQLRMFLGEGNVPADPCFGGGVELEMAGMVKETEGINSTVVTIFGSGNGFLVLRDPQNRQCLVGPSVDGRFLQSVVFDGGTNATSTDAGPDSASTETATDTATGAPTLEPQDNSIQDSKTILTIVIASFVVLLLILLAIYLYFIYKRRQKSRVAMVRKEASGEVASRWEVEDLTSEDVVPDDSISNHEVEIASPEEAVTIRKFGFEDTN